MPAELEQLTSHVRAQIQLVRLLVLPITGIALILSFIFRIQSMIESTFGARRRKNSWGGGPSGRLIAELQAVNPDLQRVEGMYLINARHACRISIPKNAVPLEQRFPFQVFGLKIEDCEVRCMPIRLQQLRQMFVETEYSTIVRDESFHVNGFPARLIVHESAADQNHRSGIQCIIETPRCYYRFMTSVKRESTEWALAAVRSLVATFESHTDDQ